MKKSKKKIIVILSLIAIIIVTLIFLIYRFDGYVLTIQEVADNSVITTSSKHLNYFEINVLDEPIIGINFHKYNISDLKENDKIFVLVMPPEVITGPAFTYNGKSLEKLHEVKLIIILESNSK